ERRVWPDTHVSPESLRIAIHRLRRALDDEGESPRYVEAIAKQGYRFRAPVTVVEGPVRITRALAILPFESSDDFAGGVVDALMPRLVQVPNILLRPMPPAPLVAACRGERRAIGRKLKVDLLLDGRLEVNGEGLRCSLQLVETADDRVTWAERFDGS